MGEEVVLREGGQPQRVALELGQLLELQRLGVCDVVADEDGGWRAARVRRVGVVRVGDVQVRIDPKLPIPHLLVLLGFDDGSAAWGLDDVTADGAAPLTDALARAFTRLLARATRQGLLRDYREVQEASQVVRGRWDITRQIATRQGAVLPIELTVDEFDVDTPPNRMLLSAALLMLRVEGVSPDAARALRSLLPRFDGVTALPPGAPPPSWSPRRTETRLVPAIRLARLILGRDGVTTRAGAHGGIGFLITMSSLFEDFVERSLTLAAREHDLQIKAQMHGWLDAGSTVLIKPDVVVLRQGRAVAVVDAKYKVEQPSGFPNADIYQAVAYAQHHGLQEAHLLYARGEVEQQQLVIPSAGVRVHRWAVDLEAPREALLRQMSRMLVVMVGAARMPEPSRGA